MAVLITAVLVIAICMLCASAASFAKIRRHLCSDLYNGGTGYVVLSAAYMVLIAFFVIAYVVYTAYWVADPMLSPIAYLVAALLFFGSVFVLMSVVVIGNSIVTILGVKLNEIDSMTGLLSKSGFEAAVQKVLDEGSQEYSLVVIDMDRFKTINDMHGHGKGDEVIRCTADILRSSVRSSDLVGRFGGDEFLMLIPSMGKGQLEAVMDRVEQAVIDSQEGLFEGVCSGISYGVASIPGGSGGHYQAFFEKADRAMYKMKRAKQGRLTT